MKKTIKYLLFLFITLAVSMLFTSNVLAEPDSDKCNSLMSDALLKYKTYRSTGDSNDEAKYKEALQKYNEECGNSASSYVDCSSLIQNVNETRKAYELDSSDENKSKFDQAVKELSNHKECLTGTANKEYCTELYQKAKEKRITYQSTNLQSDKEAYEQLKNEYKTKCNNTNDENLIEVDPDFTCADVKYLTMTWLLIRIAAPFIIILFGSLDFFKAMVASDEKQMKQARGKAIKRLIAFLLLIILPFVVQFIFSHVGTYGSQNTCLIKCIATNDQSEKGCD